MSLREAEGAYRRAHRLLQCCPRGERTFRAQLLREARKALRVAEAQALLAPKVETEEEKRLRALEERQRGREAA
jgi:hypothetical protein